MTNLELENSQQTPSKTNHIICRIIAIIIGIFLLFSALSKTQPISTFISTIYNQLPLQFTYVTLLAQFIVSLEAALGVMLIMGLLGKRRWVLWVTQILFIVFTGFVIYLWNKDGDQADCGCLGEWIKLTPIETFIKNIVLIILTTLLLFKYKPAEGSSRYIFTYVILVILFFYTILFYPAELDVDRLYAQDNKDNHPTLINGAQPDIREGKYILSFLSFTCSHCKTAAKMLSGFYNTDSKLPIIFVFNEKSKNDIEKKESFFSELPNKDVPYMFIDSENFVFLAGQSVPSIYLISDKEIDKKYDNYSKMTLEELQDWHNE